MVQKQILVVYISYELSGYLCAWNEVPRVVRNIDDGYFGRIWNSFLLKILTGKLGLRKTPFFYKLELSSVKCTQQKQRILDFYGDM